MGFIIIQPARYKVSIEVLRNLKKTGDNKFNFSLEGPRLRHILLGSRKCTEIESHYHSFVSDVTTSRQAILENRIYFWGTHFNQLCDMKTMYKILSYEGPIYTLRQWTQELLAYAFTCVYRPNTMMQDVVVLSRYLDPLVAHQTKFTGFFRTKDISDRVDAYSSSVFDELFSSKKYAVKKNSSNISHGVVTSTTLLVKRKQAILCDFNSTQSSDSNTRRKLVNTESSSCLNTIVNTTVVSSFELQLSKKGIT